MPKVSVIVPVFNKRGFLESCLDSIQKQSLPDIEIVCVDDGSTDGSSEILRERAQRDGLEANFHPDLDPSRLRPGSQRRRVQLGRYHSSQQAPGRAEAC